MGVSLLAKGMGILNTFLLVPLYLAYLDKSAYGVWLALASLLTWMRFFEFGLGNGLKNRLTNALSDENYQLGKEYVSTAYFYLLLIILGFSLLWLPTNSYLPWDQFFDKEVNGAGDIGLLILIVVSAFLANIFFRLIQSVLHAIQATRKADLIGLINNVGILTGIFILTRVDAQGGDLIKVGLIAAWLPVLGLFLATVYFFWFSNNKILKAIKPNIKSIHKAHFRVLFGLGIRFFIIQVSMLVIFQSANILILTHFSADQVVEYHILNKYFSITHMVMTLLTAPLWPAITDAFYRKEYIWIRKRVRLFFRVFALFLMLMALQFYMGDNLISFWLGEPFSVNTTLALAFIFYYAAFIFGGIYNTVMNALSRLKLQAYLLGLGALLFYPIFLFFRNYMGLGLESLVYAMFIANSYTILVAPAQYYIYIIREKKS